MSILLPQFLSVSSEWFSISGGQTFLCLSGNNPEILCLLDPPGPDLEGFQDLDTKIATGLFTSEEYPTEMTWLAKRYLYRKLSRNPSAVQQVSSFQQFKNANLSQGIGKLHSIEESLKGIFTPSTGTSNALAAEYASLSQKLEELETLDNELVLEHGGTNATLQAQRSSLLASATGASGNLKTLWAGVQSGIDAQLSPVLTENSSIVPAMQYELNEKEVNNISLSTVAVGNFDFTAAQLNLLNAIAAQCPYTGGSAVFKARALLSFVQDDVYDDEDLCAHPGERSAAPRPDLPAFVKFVVVPNPSDGEANLFYLLPPNTKQAEFLVFDLVGKTVFSRVLDVSESSFAFDSKELQNGVYLCVIRTDNFHSSTQKLIIQK